MLHHCAASFRLRTSNVTTYSDHCTVSFRQTIENLQCNTSCDKPFRPTFSDVQHTPLVRVSLQQLRTTDYGLQIIDIASTHFDLRLGICNLDTNSPGKGQPPRTTITDYGY